MTEEMLIEGILRHDRRALGLLVERYQRQVIKTAHYFLGSMEDAEDLSQEIFIEIIRAMPSFRKTSSLSTWIYRITVNRSLNHLKSRKRRAFMVRLQDIFRGGPEASPPITGEPVAEPGEHEHKEKRAIIRTAISRLPENQRIAFVLTQYDGLSYKQVAEVMNTGLPAVESLIHRARQNLRKQLASIFPEYQKTPR